VPDSEFSQTLDGGAEGFAALLDAIEAHLSGHDVPPEAIGPVMVAADEVISNILHHGGSEGRPPHVQVRVAVSGGEVAMQVEDDGPAFDPTAAAAPDISAALEDREVGGLGIHLVRQLMDDVGYARCGEFNRLRFSKRFSPPSASRPTPDGASFG
jgi:serine/threonine-protein kinase RsbW